MTTNTDDLPNGMTPEELAALAEPDEDTTATQGELEDKAAAAAANTEGQNADNQKPGANDDDAGAAAAADTGAAAAAEQSAGEPAAAAQAEPGAAPGAQSAPLLVADAPADAEAKLAEIKDKKDAVLAKFDEGDITAKEMQGELDALSKQEREIERAIDKAQIARDLEEQRRKNEWAQQCNSFLAGHPEYEGGKGERFEHLNETLIALAKMPRNASLTGPELLEKAHKLVKAERGEADTPAPKAGEKAKQPIPKPALPPNLSSVPAAGGNDPGEGRWASLDRLRDAGNGIAYEKALAALSASDRDAYLAA